MNEDILPECGRVRSELAGLVYDELPPDTRSAVEAHVATCAACAEELAALRDTARMLSRWETPASEEDPAALARTIAARARLRPVAPPRRARLVRWTALVSGAAAAVLFCLSVLNTSVVYEDGRLQLGFALPGDGAAAMPARTPAPMPSPVQSVPATWEDEIESIATRVAAREFDQRAAGFERSQDELLRQLSYMTQQELLKLSQAVDLALIDNQRKVDTRLDTLGRRAAQADLETRRAITDLAGYLPVSQTNR